MNGVATNNKKYVPSLPGLLATCDANYGRLLCLLPDCDSDSLSYRFGVSEQLRYLVRILDSTPYTSTLELQQEGEGLPAYMQPRMQVRLYHDAKMAEVIQSQHISALKGSYSYPNKAMHQKNEKEQVNRFLAEWLQFCLRHRDSRSQLNVN